jgi:hypothetical protein
MTPRTPAQAFATVAAALVDHGDVADTLSRLLTTCAELLDVSAAAVLVRDPSGDLPAPQLDLAQGGRAGAVPGAVGVRAPASTASVPGRRSRGIGAGARRPLGEVGRRITRAGFAAVHAAPLRWRGEPSAGLNLFDVRELQWTVSAGLLAQAFRRPGHGRDRAQRTRRHGCRFAERQTRPEGRTVIERAKGVLAYTRSVDMVTAYDLLVQLTEESGSTLSETAAASFGRPSASHQPSSGRAPRARSRRETLCSASACSDPASDATVIPPPVPATYVAPSCTRVRITTARSADPGPHPAQATGVDAPGECSRRRRSAAWSAAWALRSSSPPGELPHRVDDSHLTAEPAAHRRHQLVHARIGLDPHQVRHGDRARLAHRPTGRCAGGR